MRATLAGSITDDIIMNAPSKWRKIIALIYILINTGNNHSIGNP